MPTGLVFESDGRVRQIDVAPGPADSGVVGKVQVRTEKIKALRDKLKAGAATAAEKDKLLLKLASQVLSLTDDLDDA